MKYLFLFTATLLLFAISVTTQAQDVVPMADSFRQDGKIYVVIATIAAIFAGIIIYLIMLDRKVSKVEKEIKNNTSNK